MNIPANFFELASEERILCLNHLCEIRKAEIEASTEIRIAEMKTDSEIRIAEMKTDSEITIAEIETKARIRIAEINENVSKMRKVEYKFEGNNCNEELYLCICRIVYMYLK